MVIWIIGLSGAGKTELANEVVAKLRNLSVPVVNLDGDVIRNVFGNSLGYTVADRQESARRMCALSKFLDEQNLVVVCPFLSIFEQSRNWCRLNIKNYLEIFIDTPMPILKGRDGKGLYSGYEAGKIMNVVGCDILFEKPNPDQTIENNGSLDDLLAHSDKIVKTVLDVVS